MDISAWRLCIFILAVFLFHAKPSGWGEQKAITTVWSETHAELLIIRTWKITVRMERERENEEWGKTDERLITPFYFFFWTFVAFWGFTLSVTSEVSRTWWLSDWTEVFKGGCSFVFWQSLIHLTWSAPFHNSPSVVRITYTFRWTRVSWWKRIAV